MLHPLKNRLKELPRPLPRGPVFSWSNFSTRECAPLHSVEDLPFKQLTTSGRSAIYQALLQLGLSPGDVVLVPSYHCPTMIAPVVLAGGCVEYFAINTKGQPKLEEIPARVAEKAVAMLVPHYFGLAGSLSDVRNWCDANKVFLIEDCAHSLFGDAGERQVGTWGDFACASLSKFFPVPEGGVLASSIKPLKPIELEKQNIGKQVKGMLDVLQISTQHQRLTGLNTLTGAFLKLKNLAKKTNKQASSQPAMKTDYMADCDMGRISKQPLLITKLIRNHLPRSYIVERRRENFKQYARLLNKFNTSANMDLTLPETSAPYVFPFFVKHDPDSVYHSLRLAGYPVFRWDRIWPGTPAIADDVGPIWSQHVLQLLCHQDLTETDVRKTANALLQLLEAQARPTAKA
jgi:perosamine synthetase